jgi:hypothetical protein
VQKNHHVSHGRVREGRPRRGPSRDMAEVGVGLRHRIPNPQVEHDILEGDNQNEDREGDSEELAEPPRVHFVSRSDEASAMGPEAHREVNMFARVPLGGRRQYADVFDPGNGQTASRSTMTARRPGDRTRSIAYRSSAACVTLSHQHGLPLVIRQHA